MVDTYATRQSLDSDIAPYGRAIYATIPLTSGEIFAFLAPVPQDPKVLDPLIKFAMRGRGPLRHVRVRLGPVPLP